jgi:Serine/threonine protein phosphatase
VLAESSRISNFGGIVSEAINKNHKTAGIRVWVSSDNKSSIAMTRSIGDKIMKKVGVSDQADIFHRRLEKHDKFLIIASDGIWDVLTSSEAVSIVSSVLSLNKSEVACKTLVEQATKRWKKIGNCVDDISVVIVFINLKE